MSKSAVSPGFNVIGLLRRWEDVAYSSSCCCKSRLGVE